VRVSTGHPCCNQHATTLLCARRADTTDGRTALLIFPHQAVMPPSIGKVAPVTQAASSDAK
jgi:hypothetical protein